MEREPTSWKGEIRGLYPTLPEDELTMAEANFRRYIEIAVRIEAEQSYGGVFDTPTKPTNMEERSKARWKT